MKTEMEYLYLWVTLDGVKPLINISTKTFKATNLLKGSTPV